MKNLRARGTEAQRHRGIRTHIPHYTFYIILMVGLFVGIAYNTCEGDSTVVVSRKHKRVLKPVPSIRYPASSIQYPVSRIDTFIDKDRDGINDLLKKDDKNALFRFLDEKGSYYVKEKPSNTEESSSVSRIVGTEPKDDTRQLDEQKKISVKKVRKGQRK